MLNYRALLIQTIARYRLDEQYPYWAQIRVLAERGMLSAKFCKAFLHQLDPLIEHLKDFPSYLHRAPEEGSQLYLKGRPDIRLGNVVDRPDLEVGLSLQDPLFCLISGLTGYGKTTVTRVLLHAIHQYNRRHPDKKVIVFCFDRKGGDYADLPVQFGWKHFHVYDSLRLGLEPPSEMPPQTWINIISSVFCARTGLKYSWVTLSMALKTLLGLLNPKPTRRLLWPDFQLVLDFLNAVPIREFSSKDDYARSLRQPLMGISASSFKTFNAFQGFHAEDLIARGQSAVIAMPNMEPSWMRQLFLDVVICQVLKGRIGRCDRSDPPLVLFVAEEFDPDIDARTELLFTDGMSPPSECCKRGRDFNVGAVVIVSSLMRVAPLVRENATTHVVFRMGDPEAIEQAARTLMLPPGGALTFGHLPPGEALVRQAGLWPHAMRVKIDYMPPCLTKATKYDTHPYVASKRLAEMPYLQQAISDMLRGAKETMPDQATEDKRLSDAAKDLLQLATAHPFVPVARLFEKMGQLSFSRQRSIRKELEEAKLACFEEVRIGKVNMLLIEVTEAGLKMLGLKSDPHKNKGRGKLSHRTFAHWIKNHFEQKGYAAFIEGMVPGTNHPADVLLQSPEGEHQAVEICVTSSDNLLSHIQACFEACDVIAKMIVITPTKTQARQIKNQILGAVGFKPYAAKITCETIDNYIPRAI